MARSLLDYRFERLEAARQNAKSHGYKGAMFPWESSANGSEDTPVWALTGPFQHHITGCIGWAFWKYYEVTGDLDWLRENNKTSFFLKLSYLVHEHETIDCKFHRFDIWEVCNFSQ